MSYRRHHPGGGGKYSGSDSFSSDSDDGRCGVPIAPRRQMTCKRPGYYFMSDCMKRIKCGLPCVTPKVCACFTFYILLTLMALAFLYFYGMTLMMQLSRLSRIFLQMVLPASWLKSTRDIVHEALAKYSADRLGLADYALESAGGSVLCSSDTYFAKSGPLYSVFGIPLWYHTSSPREVIQPDVQPGKCWAMDSPQGYITIQLAMPIVVSAISLEHIPREVAPSGRLDSAPKDFVIIGKQRSMNSPDIALGSFTYHIGGDPIQVFDIKDPYCMAKFTDDTGICGANKVIFHIITLKVISNHGNPDYTCIYRLRVHGEPPSHAHLLPP